MALRVGGHEDVLGGRGVEGVGDALHTWLEGVGPLLGAVRAGLVLVGGELAVEGDVLVGLGILAGRAGRVERLAVRLAVALDVLAAGGVGARELAAVDGGGLGLDGHSVSLVGVADVGVVLDGAELVGVDGPVGRDLVLVDQGARDVDVAGAVGDGGVVERRERAHGDHSARPAEDDRDERRARLEAIGTERYRVRRHRCAHIDHLKRGAADGHGPSDV